MTEEIVVRLQETRGGEGFIRTSAVIPEFSRRNIGKLWQRRLLKAKGMKEADLGVDDGNPAKAIEL